MNDTPLIWTINGNLPVENLDYAVTWKVTEDYIKLVETYKLDGEIVRENAHVYSLKPISVFGEAGALS